MRTNHFQVRRFANDALLFPVGDMADYVQGVIKLNEVSKYVWELLETPKTFDEIVDNIITTFDVSLKKVQLDLNDLLLQFERNGIIQIILYENANEKI